MLELINGFKRNCVCSFGIEFRLTVWRIYVFINHAIPRHFFYGFSNSLSTCL